MPVITPEDFLREARSWVGTRYVHQGRVKRNAHNLGGCDCLGLLVGVVRELRMLSDVRDSQGEPLGLSVHLRPGGGPERPLDFALGPAAMDTRRDARPG